MSQPSSPQSSASSFKGFIPGGFKRTLRRRPVWMILVLVLAVFGGYYLGRSDLLDSGELDPSKGRIRLRPGPWGDVEYLPITIAPPRKLLRVQAIEDQAVHWYFPGATQADFVGLLNRLNLSEPLRNGLVSPKVLSVHPQGVRLDPTCDQIRDLGEPARRKLYEIMANHGENNPQRWEFLTAYTKTFPKFNVTRATAKALKDVSIPYGRHTVTYSMACVLAGMTDPEEKVGLIKALSQQNSMLVRIRIGPKTDVAALANYWGKGMWTTDVEAILESIRQRPDGGVINILELLPPIPAALMHSYPAPHNFLAGPEVIKNCSWTAFNFFRDVPKDEFANEDFVIKTLAEDYYPVLSDPRYGDIAVFLTPERTMRHVAVFLADNLFYTKNGENPWHPWVYSTLEDLLENFSFGLPQGQELSVHYFRSKGY